MLRILCISLFLFSTQLLAKDLTSEYESLYSKKSSLSSSELKALKKTRVIFIPGILAETFQRDSRSILNLSFLTKEYFGIQLKHLKQQNLDVVRLKTSSKDILTTIKNIKAAIIEARKDKKKIIFMAHSLGGLALTEVLLDLKRIHDIQGVFYLQTPFYGSPVANVYNQNSYYIQKLLRPLLPFFNTSEQIIDYLTIESRNDFMSRHSYELKKLVRNVPMISIVGKANKSITLFEPAVNIIEFGCLSAIFDRCLSKKIYQGNKDLSDGMVPLKSGLFPGSHSITLKGVDHGETVVYLGPGNINQKTMIDVLLKLLQRHP